jgi:3-oxoacyl-[acyl-carrier protein] reductase
LSEPKALVFGGSGVVGAEVLRGLARAGVPTAFTFNRSHERAHALAAEFSQRALEVELSSPNATRAALRALQAEGFRANVFIHCAGVNRLAKLRDLTDEDWQLTQAVNLQSAFIAIQELAPQMAAAKELGPSGVCINLVSLGLLEGGLSREVDAKLVADYKNFSALRRLGQPAEVAKAILWLALENTYMNGRVLAVNGGM